MAPPVSPPTPAATVKLELEDLHDDEHGPLRKRAKAAQPTPPQQDMYHNVLDEPSPLGLRLRKSPSLLDLIQMRLSQANSNAGQSMDNCSAEPPMKKDLKSGTSAAGERLKASNFPANILRIGTWEITEDGKYCLVLVFEAKALELSDFEKRQAKFTSFFGPGIKAEIGNGGDDLYEVRLISETT